MARSVPQKSKVGRHTISLNGDVVHSPVDDFWISLPHSIRITVYNSCEQKSLINRIVPYVTFKQLAFVVAQEIFEFEPLAEFILLYKSWTPSGDTVWSAVDLDQTVGAFHDVLDLQVVQVNLQRDDWTWYVSKMGFLQTRERIQVAPSASPVQDPCCTGSYGMSNYRDSAIFTMLHPNRSQALSRPLSVIMSQPQEAFQQSATPAEILKLNYTQNGQIVSTPCAQDVKVTIYTEGRQRLFTTEVIGETKFEDLAVKNCAQICGGLRATRFTFKTISPPGPDFLLPDIVVGGFGTEVNIIAVEVGDADRWFWSVGNTVIASAAGYLEKRMYYR
ncbi:uncharacterized protein LOC144917135 [Branchiostoma floridae x Branchiostoma belcheri]